MSASQKSRRRFGERNIKVLTNLRVLFCPARYRHAGPNGPEAGLQRAVARFFCCLKQDEQDGQDEQDERGLGAAQQLWLQRHPFFRAMSQKIIPAQSG